MSYSGNTCITVVGKEVGKHIIIASIDLVKNAEFLIITFSYGYTSIQIYLKFNFKLCANV